MQLTTSKQRKSKEELTSRKDGMPAASLREAMYFAAAEHSSTASENIYLHEEILTFQRSPVSPLNPVQYLGGGQKHYL